MAHRVNKALGVSMALGLAACAQPVPAPSDPASLQVVPPSYYSRTLKTRTYMVPSKKRGAGDATRTIVIEREIPVYLAAPSARERSRSIDTGVQEIQDSVREVQEKIRKVPE